MKMKIIGLAALFAVMPVTSAVATTVASTGTAPDAATYQQEDDDDFPWGLLGLLGLAGLLGRKRNDDHVNRTSTNSKL